MSTETAVVDSRGTVTRDTVAGGIEVPAGSTPQDIFNHFLKAEGVTPKEPERSAPFHPESHARHLAMQDANANPGKIALDATYKAQLLDIAKLPEGQRDAARTQATLQYQRDVMRFMPGEQPAGPPPVTRERPGSAVKITDAPAVPANQVDRALLDRLNAVYRGMNPQERAARQQQYENELAEIYAGRRTGETRQQFYARVGAEAPFTPRESPPPADKHGVTATPLPEPLGENTTPDQWTEHHASVTDAEGWIPYDKVDSRALSGYTLPRLLEDQTVSSSVFGMLAAARKAGISQDQVNAVFREQMKADGWLQ